MEWTISIEWTNEFGDISRKEVRIDKSDERLRDGDIGLSIEDGKNIMAALQTVAVAQEAEAKSRIRKAFNDIDTLRAVW